MGLYLSLALFAALSSNLMLQFGLGLCSLNHIGNSTARLFAFRASALFCSVMSVWIVAFYLMTPMGLGLLGNVFLLPLTVLGHGLYSRALKRFFPPGEEPVENYTQSGNSLSLVGSYLTLTLASALAEALVLALGFSLGLLFSFLLVREIEKRSRLEAVPPCLRGSPLLLISIGFLSLIFSSASALLLGAAGFF